MQFTIPSLDGLTEHLQKDIFHYLSQEFQGIHPSLVKQKTI